MIKHKQRVSVVPASMLFDRTISFSDKLVLQVIGVYAEADGWTGIAQKVIADHLDLSRSAVSKSIKALVGAGYLEAKSCTAPGRGRAASRYRVRLDLDTTVTLEADVPTGNSADPMCHQETRVRDPMFLQATTQDVVPMCVEKAQDIEPDVAHRKHGSSEPMFLQETRVEKVQGRQATGNFGADPEVAEHPPLSSPLTPPLVPPLLSSPTPPSNNPPYNPPQSTPQQTPGKPAETGLFAAEELPGTDLASKPKPKRARIAYTPEFEAFWKSWPQTRREHSDKQTAFRRWSDGVERWGVDAIMAAAKRYLSKPDTRKEGWRFCVLAEVFLNGKLEAAVEAALEAQAKAGGSATFRAANATSDDAEARKWARRYEGWCENPNIWAVAWGDKPDDPRHKGPGLDAVRHLMTPNPPA